MATYGWADLSAMLIGGYDFLPYVIQELTLPEGKAILDEVRPAGSIWMVRRDSTQRDTKNPLQFMCDYDDTAASTTAAGPDALLASLPTGTMAFVMAIEGGAVATRAVFGLVKTAEYERITSDSKLHRIKASMPIDGIYSTGLIHSPQSTQRTADFNTQAASIDNGFAAAAVNIVSSSVANPSVITATAHGLVSTDTILIAGHTGTTPDINGVHVVTVTGVDTFTIPVNVTVGGGATGTMRRTNTRAGGRVVFSVPDTTACPFALGTHTGLVLDLRGSGDNSTFAALATATALTARGDQIIEISGNIPRYIACGGDFTGAGSPTANALIAFERYPE